MKITTLTLSPAVDIEYHTASINTSGLNRTSTHTITAGGKGNADKAYHHVRAMMRMLNATGYDEHWVVSPSTDTIPADQDEAALSGVRSIAAWLNE